MTFLVTHQGTFNPNSMAFFAINPDISNTDGLEVFVQLVIDAKQTLPFSSWCSL